jgi:hypothetical protein
MKLTVRTLAELKVCVTLALTALGNTIPSIVKLKDNVSGKTSLSVADI